jgi:signal transduction histidine kinase
MLTIQDDGIGFQEKSNGKGYGMRNMRDRARLLGGTLRIESSSGKGTTILLSAPWEVEE